VGISVDEVRTFTMPLPVHIENETLRGAETEFTVTAKQVFERTLPGLDDAFASTVGAFETLADLRQDIYDRILQVKQQQEQEDYRNALVEMLVEPAEVQYPPVMLEETLDQMLEDTDSRMQRDRQISLEDALRLEGRTVDQFREDLVPQAEKRTKTSLVLAEFARVEETTVSDDDVVHGYRNLLMNMGLNLPTEFELPALSLDSDIALNIRFTLLGSKALERLERIGRGLADADPDEAEGLEIAARNSGEDETEPETLTEEREETEDAGSETEDAGSETEDAGSETEDAGSETEDVASEAEDADLEAANDD
ncbi:MAG: hypothetical protein P1S60_03720, partial [Anaerolineae bacterium]|nr:hypothetical protein [Anaerolineae bacterium]